jgi:hypothetical protein
VKDIIAFVGLIVVALIACPLGVGLAWAFITGAELYWHTWMSIFGYSGLSLVAWALTIVVPPLGLAWPGRG